MERRGYTPQTAEHKTERTRALTATLEQQVAAVTDSVAFRAYLDLQSRLYRFSWNNTLLILAQYPQASLVMGMRKWNDLGRFVNKGAHGLDIFAPVFPAGTKKEEESSTPPVSYIPVKVFDVAQTNGKPLPAFDVPVLQGDEGQDLYVKTTLAALKHDLLVVEDEELPVGMMGGYRPSERSITIARSQNGESISQQQRLKTLMHEYAHGLLKHGHPEDQSTTAERELAAEGSAYVTMKYFGYDSGERSFNYLAAYAEHPRALKPVLGTIQRTSRRMIDAIEVMATAADPLALLGACSDDPSFPEPVHDNPLQVRGGGLAGSAYYRFASAAASGPVIRSITPRP
jgi:hypothetical protein